MIIFKEWQTDTPRTNLKQR